MNQHNEKNWNEFIKLRNLIELKPNDIKLLKKELKENYYQQRLNSLSDLKAHMSEKFEQHFFGRDIMRFFGTSKITFIKKEMTVICKNKNTTAVYDVVFEGENLSLRHV